MKVALIIAHTASGWSLLTIGEDVSRIKADFKEIKVAGVHVTGGEAADVVMFLDSAGNIRRKRLDDPQTAALVAAANGSESDREAEARRKAELEGAVKEGQLLADKAAEAALGAIAGAILEAGSAPVHDTSADAGGQPAAESDDADTENHFGAKPKKKG